MARKSALRATLCAFAALAASVAAPTAASAAGWLAPVTVQPGPAATAGTSNATTASNAAGAQALAWNDNVKNADGGSVCTSTGEVVSRAPGGAWSASSPTGCGTVVAVGPNDEVVAVWGEGKTTLYAASAPAGQPLGQPVQIAAAAHNIWTPIIRFDPAGTPTIVWAEETVGVTDSSYALKTSTRAPTGTWTPTTAVAAASLTQPEPDLAFGPAGDAVLVHNKYSGTTGYSVKALYRSSNSSSWVAAPSALYGPTSAGSLSAEPVVSFDPQGRATVLHAFMTSTTPTYELDTWTRGAGISGTWSAKQVVPNSTGGASQDVPEGDLAFDSKGNGLVAWIGGTDSPCCALNVRVATRGPGGTAWSSNLVSLASPDFSVFPSIPDVVFDSNDNATVAFSVAGALKIFSRPAGSTVFGPQSLPPGISGSNPSIATDANGYMIATWTDANGITSTSVYDPVAPSIDTADVPANAIAGDPVSFNIAGSDVWGPVTYSIDFGDGQPPATGRVFAGSAFTRVLARATTAQSVSHTYTQPGSYTATVSVTDGASNTSSTTRPIAIGAATTPPAPLPPVTGLPDPVLGISVNIAPVKPVVLVKTPGSRKFVPLVAPAQVRVGSIIDARKGRVRITIADGRGRFFTSDFYEGMFKILQQKKLGSVAALQLKGGSFKGCPRAPKAVIFSRKSKKRSVRHLWGKGSGAFRTVGRFASATVRGTNWLTDDRCNGTLVRVKQGKIAVRDFVKRKTIVLKAPKRYLARPRAKR